ncbi:MAG TPA: glycoside hydrolase family 3 N-terminal domain-containing protein [Pyrinomonadaceae bacterium]|jgi:beta-N-acetylhexosaminidase|nr:glycoside hydrolase family 3 N-terminal domain-containing protein [Pyrinomonadaceae bacterium]
MSQAVNRTRPGESLSIKQKAGRLLFIGLPGTRLDRRQRKLLGEVQPGGVVLFGRNIETAEQVAHLNVQIRDAVEHPVLLGVDQEGGLVDRFRTICEPSPSAKAVRDAGQTDLARKFGELTARLLRLLGFNMNFAPVLDLSGDNLENGLRGRTFGRHPSDVSRLAGAYLDGLQGGRKVDGTTVGRVLGCGKHFPGLGGSSVDSHRRLPVVTHSWEEIFERDLVPFMDLMFHTPGERLYSAMVSHAAFPEVSEFLQAWFRRTQELPSPESMHQLPATISGNVVMRLLRQALKFDGLVITDDMEMGAVVQTLSVAEASLRAIQAGSDMILICEQEANFVAARDAIVEAVEKGDLAVEALDKASQRIDDLLKIAGEYEPFDQAEFDAVSRDMAELKHALKAAENSEEYAPLYGTSEGGKRQSSNF